VRHPAFRHLFHPFWEGVYNPALAAMIHQEVHFHLAYFWMFGGKLGQDLLQDIVLRKVSTYFFKSKLLQWPQLNLMSQSIHGFGGTHWASHFGIIGGRTEASLLYVFGLVGGDRGKLDLAGVSVKKGTLSTFYKRHR